MDQALLPLLSFQFFFSTPIVQNQLSGLLDNCSVHICLCRFCAQVLFLTFLLHVVLNSDLHFHLQHEEPVRSLEHLFHRADVVDRQVRVERADFFLDGRCQRVRRAGVPVIVMDSDGNLDEFAEIYRQAGFNAICPIEVAAGNDLLKMRRRFGKRLALQGGFDKRILTRGKEAIRTEVMRLFPEMMAEGERLRKRRRW